VANGIRIAVVILAQHISSHIIVAGHRNLITYEGQPTTFYGFNETGHLYQACPRRRRTRDSDNASITTSWGDVAARGSLNSKTGTEVMEVGVETAELETSAAKTYEDYSGTPLGGKAPDAGGERADESSPAGNSAQHRKHL